MTLTGENPFQATETAATFKPGAEPKFLYKAEPNQRQQGPMILSGSNPFQKVETAPTFKSAARPPHWAELVWAWWREIEIFIWWKSTKS